MNAKGWKRKQNKKHKMLWVIKGRKVLLLLFRYV